MRQNLKTTTTMRYLRFIAVISLLMVAVESYACYNPWYSEVHYNLYRLEERESNTPSKRMANLMEWQAMTSPEIAIEDIEKVVYEMDLETFEALYNAERYSGNNAFARWIKEHDQAIMDFLLLAKRNEHIRFQYNSLWYYPSMKIKGPTSLEEIVELSYQNTDSRLHHRYMLQALRALFTLNRYEECIALWNEEFDKLDRNHTMRRHAQMYMAGALYNCGMVEQALVEYAEIGDVDSIYYISNRENLNLEYIAIIEMLYRNNPDNSEVLSMLYNRITYFDGNPFNEDTDMREHNDYVELTEIGQMAARLAKDGFDPALWNYTAAYVYALQGNEAEARKAIAKADKSSCSPYMRESIEVMKIFIDAKYCNLDKSYYKRLHEQMRWLNSKIEEYSPAIADSYGYSPHYYTFPVTHDYWKTTSQMIVNTLLCPRLVDDGQSTLALQLANMSSNFTAKCINKVNGSWYGYDEFNHRYGYYGHGIYTFDEYRYNRSTFNALDFSSYFFYLANTVDTDDFKAYLDVVEQPVTSFDKYLNECGNTDNNYLNEFMGTRYIRDSRYEEALHHLEKVEFRYNYALNQELHEDYRVINSRRDPSTKVDHDFRFNFAKYMVDLERGITNESDPNRRARMTVYYGYAVLCSTSRCWELCYYQDGEVGHVYRDYIWWRHDMSERRCGYEIINEGIEMFTDREMKAEILYLFENYLTVAKEYSDTYYGKYVIHHCDNLCDYETHKPYDERQPHTKMWWW